jgi:hypothetical protein
LANHPILAGFIPVGEVAVCEVEADDFALLRLEADFVEAAEDEVWLGGVA